MPIVTGATTSAELRAHNRARLLRTVHDGGAGRTRSQLTKDLGLSRGAASVLVGGLVADGLLHEGPAAEHGRGRPTQIPGPHPRGPIALAVDLREDGWDLAAGELGGRTTLLAARAHDGTPDGAFGPLGHTLATHLQRYGSRAVGIGLAVPGPVREGRLVDVSHLGWRAVDAPALLMEGGLPLHVGNDTAYAALAEARRGRLAGVHVGLHLHVDFDLGGVLVVGGRPLGGASGAGAEFGHMPLTGGTAPCACGARGCWGMDVGSYALLRHLGLAAGGGRGRDQARAILAKSAQGDPAAQEAVLSGARALGRGIAALVNAHDPEIVTLSGLGVELHAQGRQVLEEAFLGGLMTIRGDHPPELAASELAWGGALRGAMESVFDAFLTPAGLTTWRAPD
ncbi:ROK family transcriptional regulator [Nonomuraea typhae]|uniref:ROK family transcriptional regulator n=1 Tax=Nonomuraea typhae TaxID=2603600 RepID=UPI001FE70C78|nr:ROK family transcriptional regulator [Nonomuraea typhae]